MEFNREERRAIERGEGRKHQMVEIEDIGSAYDYWLSLTVQVGLCRFERLFINWQVEYDWVIDDWDQLNEFAG